MIDPPQRDEPPGAPPRVPPGSISNRRALVASKASSYLASLAGVQPSDRAVVQSGKPLGEFLVESLKITREQLEEALEEQKQTRELLGVILVRKGLVREENIRDILHVQKGVVFVDIKKLEIPRHILNLVPEHIIRQHKILPIEYDEQKLTIGMVQPENLIALEVLRFRFKQTLIEPVKIAEDAYYHFLANHFSEPSVRLPQTVEDDVVNDLDDIDTQRDMRILSEVPIIKVANSILAQGLRKKASDIHIEPHEHEIVVRYRVDGVLHKDQSMPTSILLPLVSRFKIMANLDIAEKRLPQDGRIRIRIRGRDIDFRVSSIPSKYGEKLCMRLLDKANTMLGLDKLFIIPELLEVVRTMASRPNGIIFMTGPTGSGKTTTTYSILAELNGDDVNIVTAEDPIEYELKGITQVQVKPEIGLTFASILKSFLRQDPDIMLIGETRDKELAKIAIEAALTGHLVFTSMHTNDAPGAITRLQEMGIDGFLIAAATVGVINQRVVRALCKGCRELYVPSPKELDYLGFPHESGERVEWYRPHLDGCDSCVGGYKGRVGVYEVLLMNDELRDLIAQGSPKAMIRYAAKQAGMITLKDYAIRLIASGFTSYEELLRVIYTNEGQEKLCPTCRNVVGEEFMKCPFCQSELRQVCPNCQRAVQDSWLSCPSCGHMLKDIIHNGRQCHICRRAMEPTWKACPVCAVLIEEERVCPNCKQPVQAGWAGCPLCLLPAEIKRATPI